MKKPTPNTVILRKDVEVLIRRVRRRSRLFHWSLHLVGLLLLAGSLVLPFAWKIKSDLVTASYEVVKGEFENIRASQKILSLLRTKSLTIGQGLDISETILSQQEVPVSMVLAIMETESSFNPDAVSSHGARGLLQTMPLTARTYAGGLSKNIHDPIVNIKAAMGYLADLRKAYGDNWPKILRCFNGGPKNADNKALDPYVRLVMNRADKYQEKMDR